MANNFATVALNNTYDLSRDGTLYIGGVKLEGFKSGSISFSADSIDNSTRDDEDWGISVPGRRNASLSVTMNKVIDGSAECQKGLRDLFLSSTFGTRGVEVIYRSESTSTAPGTGFKGVFILTGYSESQSYNGEAVEISIELASYGSITADTAT